MSVKTKISLGIAFLFVVITLIGGLGVYYLERLDTDAQAIIKDNYRTLSYVQRMFKSMGDLQNMLEEELITRQNIANLSVNQKGFRESLSAFEQALEAQSANLTEAGEKELTNSLQKQYSELVALFDAPLSLRTYAQSGLPLIKNINGYLTSIYELNQDTVLEKNEKARITADRVIVYMLVIGSISMLVSLLFLLVFPNYIARPIKKLNESMKQIARKNYQHRIDVTATDEFGALARSFNTMAEKLKEYESTNLAQMLFEKKRTETIINKMSEAIIGLDENKVVLFANPKALHLLGMEENSLIHKYAPDVASANPLMHELIQELMISFNEWETVRYKPVEITEDGKESYYEKEIMDITMRDAGEARQKLIGHVIILKNVTRIKEIDQAKTAFMSGISHEMKTPISSIKMSLQLLEDERIGKLNNEQKELVLYIKDESEHLLRITHQMMELAQAKTGQLQLKTEPVNPDDIVRYALHTVKILAEEKQVILEYPHETGLPEVDADAEKIAWVMGSLLTNAIQNSSPGKKVIVDIVEKNNKIRFSVEDFGECIPEDQVEKVFDRYFQLPEQFQVGTGMELSVLQNFVQQQRGTIWLESKRGTGNKFYFTLPYSKKQRNSVQKQ